MEKIQAVTARISSLGQKPGCDNKTECERKYGVSMGVGVDVSVVVHFGVGVGVGVGLSVDVIKGLGVDVM